MKIILKIVTALIVIGALVGGLYLVRKNQETRRGAAVAETSSSILPDAVKVDVGQEFTVNLWVNTGSETDKLTGGELVVGFNQTIVELTKLEAADQLYSLADQTDLAQANQSGQVRIAVLAMDGEKAGAMALAKLTFKAKANGQAEIKPAGKLTISGQEIEWDTATNNKSIATAGTGVAPTGVVGCVPKPACVNGIKDSQGNIVYCDPEPLAPGQVYCKGTAGEGEMCGGIKGITCAEGLICRMKDGGGVDDGRMRPMIADATGICAKEDISKTRCNTDADCPANSVCSAVPPQGCPNGTACATAPRCWPKLAAEGQACGGFMNVQCQSGLTCDYGGGVDDGRMRPMIASTAGVCRKTTSSVKCGWCGTNCTAITNTDMRCPEVMPPTGQSCVEKEGKCTIVPSGTGTCGQRCTMRGGCDAGLTCVPIWWQCSVPVPSGIMAKLSTDAGLEKAEVESLSRICPMVKQVIGDDYQTEGLIKMPSFYGVCRNTSCPNVPNCNCGVVTSTPTPTPTPTVISGNQVNLKGLFLMPNVSVGDEVGAEIIINSNGMKVSGIKTQIIYSTEYLDLVEAIPVEGATVLKNDVDRATGKVGLSLSWSLPADKLPVSPIAAKLKFKTKKVGTGTFRFDRSVESEVTGLDKNGVSTGFVVGISSEAVGISIVESAKCKVCTSGITKAVGNANCDNVVNLVDFELWRNEMFDKGGINGLVRADWDSDYNCDSKVSLSDFEIWRNTVFK